jgi:hypothetical protein
MSEQPPLDLRALAEVDEPEVVREALHRFRRRLWTRYLWIGIAVVAAAVALVVGSRPTNLREEMEAANVRTFPAHTYRFDDVSVALAEVSDLGDTMGLHFVLVPDAGGGNPAVWVEGLLVAMGHGTYDNYIEAAKVTDGRLAMTVGGVWCLPSCKQSYSETIDLRELGVPPQIWKEDA